MSWRFYRRTNLGCGLGINWSKSGASLSIRTPLGSINSRGRMSIRTPIKGLQWVQYANKKQVQQSYSYDYQYADYLRRYREWYIEDEKIKRYNDELNEWKANHIEFSCPFCETEQYIDNCYSGTVVNCAECSKPLQLPVI